MILGSLWAKIFYHQLQVLSFFKIKAGLVIMEHIMQILVSLGVHLCTIMAIITFATLFHFASAQSIFYCISYGLWQSVILLQDNAVSLWALNAYGVECHTASLFKQLPLLTLWRVCHTFGFHHKATF